VFRRGEPCVLRRARRTLPPPAPILPVLVAAGDADTADDETLGDGVAWGSGEGEGGHGGRRGMEQARESKEAREAKTEGRRGSRGVIGKQGTGRGRREGGEAGASQPHLQRPASGRWRSGSPPGRNGGRSRIYRRIALLSYSHFTRFIPPSLPPARPPALPPSRPPSSTWTVALSACDMLPVKKSMREKGKT
jgi:hypothetical protein